MSNIKATFTAPVVTLIAKTTPIYPAIDMPYPTDDVAVVGKIASICYGEKSDRYSQIAKGCMARGHESVAEHLSYTFRIDGLSRACAQQLTRHRLASYTMESQRYTDQKDTTFTIPDAIAQDEVLRELYCDTIDHCLRMYRRLRAEGIKAEDARSVLPISATTSLYVTMNIRELRHFFKMRMAQDAQAEIRYVACQMYTAIVDEYSATWDEGDLIFDLIGNPDSYYWDER